MTPLLQNEGLGGVASAVDESATDGGHRASGSQRQGPQHGPGEL